MAPIVLRNTLLPDGPYGYTLYADARVEGEHIGADVNTIAHGDFDNDGDIDLVSFDEKVAVTGSADGVEVSFENTESINKRSGKRWYWQFHQY